MAFIFNSGLGGPDTPIKDAFIGDLLTLEKVEFTYMPQQFSEAKQAEYSQVPIMGRSEPLLGYGSSTGRIFQIGLSLLATGDKGGSRDTPDWQQRAAEEEVIKPLRLLSSWVYPDYRNDRMSIPPRLLLVIGSWLSIRVVLINYSAQYMAPYGRQDVGAFTSNTNFSPVDGPLSLVQLAGGASDSLIPYRADVAMTLQEVNDNSATTPWDTFQVRSGANKITGQF